MLNEAGLFNKAALTLLRGHKLSENDSPAIIYSFYELLRGMHAGHFIPAEPQTYIQRNRYSGTDPKYLGLSHIHPQPYALIKEAESLLSVARQKGADISDFEIFGLNHDKRHGWHKGKEFKLDSGKVGILLPGDIVSFAQVTSLIDERFNNPGVHYTTPIIIQDSGHFWEPWLKTGSAKWKKEQPERERLNIHYSAGAAETADILAGFTHGRKISPHNVVLKLSDTAPVEREDEVFFTTDKVKFNHAKKSQETFYAGDSVHMGIDVIGPFPSADEQTYSLEGNADEKMESVYDRHAELLKTLGRRGVEQLYLRAGIKDISTVKIIVNDGGWGVILESKSGQRKIDLFTKEYFPNTVHKLNPIQMGPYVEYAYMKRTDGLEYMNTQLERRVDHIVNRQGSRFKRSDLVIYDSSVFMSVPLTRILDAIEAGAPYNAADLGVVSVFSGQKLALAQTPYRGPYTGVVDTVDYFIPKTPHGNQLTRSQIPDWFMTGPNVEAHRLNKMVKNVDQRLLDDQPQEVFKKGRGTIKMGMLGSLDALTQRRASAVFQEIKGTLLDQFGISTRLRPDYWDAYRNKRELVFAQAGGPSNTAYLAGTRLMLDASSVFFAGNTSRGDVLSDRQKVYHLLPLVKAMVRNQVFNHTDIVVDAESATGKLALDLIRRKQELGLIQQRTEHLAHFVEGTQAAAEKIAEIVKGDRVVVPPIKRQFFTDGQKERKDAMIVSVYCSATNCNKALIDKYERLGMLLAINGFSLKVGGGNDGLMKAVSDGFLKGKAALKEKGYDFPNELILIQCVDTEAIEKRYEGEGESIYRCHASIEPRKADIQQSDIHINGAGGAGSDEEFLADILSRMEGMINPASNPMIWFDAQMQTARGTVGVHDFYKENFSPGFLESINANTWTLTPEETVAQACRFREKQEPQFTISLASVRDSLRNAHAKAAALAQQVKGFRPPFGAFISSVEEIPPHHLASAPAAQEPKIA